MKKKLAIVLCVVMLAMCISLVACNNSTDVDLDGKTKVVFELEGGMYKNSDLPVVYWFGFESGTQNLIIDFLSANEKNKIERTGYVLEGWYRTKTVNDDNVVYSDKWDFSTDKVTNDGVTLYAKWVRPVSYTYQIYYKNATNEDVAIGSPYFVNEGSTFMDIEKYATKTSTAPANHTFVRFVDEEGNPWDNSFKHPGGDVNTEIKVYAEYVEGDWYIVQSESDLKKSKNSKKDIYLIADIDLGGDEFVYGDLKNRTFNGNGHTISNFKIMYDQRKNGLLDDIDGTQYTLYVSFFHIVENAEIKGLTLSNISIDLNASNNLLKKVYVAPLCVHAIDSSISDTTATGNYSLIDVHDKAEQIIVLDKLVANNNGSTISDDCSANLTDITQK